MTDLPGSPSSNLKPNQFSLSLNQSQRPIHRNIYQALRFAPLYQNIGLRKPKSEQNIGQMVGQGLGAKTLRELIHIFELAGLGTLGVSNWSSHGMSVSIKHCTCEGLPIRHECICHFEGGILLGAVSQITGRDLKDLSVQETTCYVNGNDSCHFEITFLQKDE